MSLVLCRYMNSQLVLNCLVSTDDVTCGLRSRHRSRHCWQSPVHVGSRRVAVVDSRRPVLPTRHRHQRVPQVCNDDELSCHTCHSPTQGLRCHLTSIIICLLTPTVATAIKHPVPDRVKLSFVIFDIRALWRSIWRSVLSVRVPGCQKLQMTVWHRMLYSYTHMTTVVHQSWHTDFLLSVATPFLSLLLVSGMIYRRTLPLTVTVHI